MKKIRLLLLLPLFTPLLVRAQTATYVSGCTANETNAGMSISCLYPSSQASGSLLVINSKKDNTVPDPITSLSVTATLSGVTGTCAQVGNVTNSSNVYTTAFAACLTSSAGTPTVTLTWNGATTDAFVDLASGSYTATNGFPSYTIDRFVSQSNTAGSTADSGTTATTTSANELVVFVSDNWNTAQTYPTAPTSYSSNRTLSSRNTTGWFDKSVSTIGTQSGSVAINNDVSVAAVLTFPLTSTSSPTVSGHAIIF
jgi:hypothetical protein